MEMIATPTPAATPDPLEAFAHPPGNVGVVELRGDLFPELDPATITAACPLPLLYTLRSRAEGGRGPSETRLREDNLRRAWESGCAFVDLEAERDTHLLGTRGVDRDRTILSWHDPNGTPPDLEQRAARLLSSGVRWVKIVPTATDLGDLAAVLRLHGLFNGGVPVKRRLIAFAMGAVGQASRYLAPLLGPPMAYVAWSPTAPAAPGQVTADALLTAIGHLDRAPRKVFGVVGRNVTSSRSPQLHGAAYASLGLPWVLLPFSVPDAGELDLLFRPGGETLLDDLGLRVGGWAVTSPYKERAARAATVAAPRVRRARSANTLLLRPGQILADTTDADGVIGGLVAVGVDPAGFQAIVQGTGGAARAAAVGLDLAGARVFLRGRIEAHTRKVAESIRTRALPPGEVPAGQLILVNATPLGSRPEDPLPFSQEEIARASAVVDMVYGPVSTGLEEAAAAAGIPSVDGLGVLLHQGIAQIAAFSGRVPDREILRKALRPPNVATP